MYSSTFASVTYFTVDVPIVNIYSYTIIVISTSPVLIPPQHPIPPVEFPFATEKTNSANIGTHVVLTDVADTLKHGLPKNAKLVKPHPILSSMECPHMIPNPIHSNIVPSHIIKIVKLGQSGQFVVTSAVRTLGNDALSSQHAINGTEQSSLHEEQATEINTELEYGTTSLGPTVTSQRAVGLGQGFVNWSIGTGDTLDNTSRFPKLSILM